MGRRENMRSRPHRSEARDGGDLVDNGFSHPVAVDRPKPAHPERTVTVRKPIPVTQPFMPPLDEYIPYLSAIWETKWLTNGGTFHQQLERELAGHLGVDHVSLFANGTIALVTALQSLRITGEVITTPYSFVATTHSLWWNNISPIFVDIDAATFNLDPAKIEEAITPRTTATWPFTATDNRCDVTAIRSIADKYGLRVIYDAAHAFQVEYRGASLLRHGDLSVLSFHATKVFTTFKEARSSAPTKPPRRGSTISRTSASSTRSLWRRPDLMVRCPKSRLPSACCSCVTRASRSQPALASMRATGTAWPGFPGSP